jgi:hypothetical protein
MTRIMEPDGVSKYGDNVIKNLYNMSSSF